MSARTKIIAYSVAPDSDAPAGHQSLARIYFWVEATAKRPAHWWAQSMIFPGPTPDAAIKAAQNWWAREVEADRLKRDAAERRSQKGAASK